MALVQQNTPYAYIDTPLSEPEIEEWWPPEYYDEVLIPDPMVAVQRRMAIILLAAVVFVFAFGIFVTQKGDAEAANVASAETQPADAAAAPAPAAPASGAIAPLFTAEIQHWAPQIIAWSAEVGIDPNMAATIMQVESCGDPNAVSVAGAQGLFQVMPFHFTEGEQMQDPDTNARKGLRYFADRLTQTAGDVGRAFAGYNGGHVAAGGSWDTWYPETQRYYTWTTGIFADAQAGSATSATLDQWLAAGGAGLCRQASQRLGLQ